jgi:hypothetical protein
MPRAALLSINARVAGTGPGAWEDPPLVQVWGPRYSTYVVASEDVGVFTLGRLPDDPKRRLLAEETAARVAAVLDGREMSDREVGEILGRHPSSLRYAAPTGTVLIRWPGAGAPTLRSVPAPEMDPITARGELARRHLHSFGAATPETLSDWAGIKPRAAAETFDRLRRSLTPVRTPIGDAWILSRDEDDLRAGPGPPAPARLLPSGDIYYLLQGSSRELLVEDADHRNALWTSRVWPGAVMVAGEIVGTWRRAAGKVTIETWRRLSQGEREAVAAEASALPLPGVDNVVLEWDD